MEETCLRMMLIQKKAKAQDRHMDTKGGKVRWGGDGGVLNWAIGIDMYTLMCIKLVTNKNLLYKKINKIKLKKKKRKKKKPPFFWDCEQGGKFDFSLPMTVLLLLGGSIIENENKWKGIELRDREDFIFNSCIQMFEYDFLFVSWADRFYFFLR